MLPKMLGLALVLVTTLLVGMARRHPRPAARWRRWTVDPGKYLLWYLLPSGVDVLLIAVLAVFVAALSPSKYAGWGIMLVFILLLFFGPALGLEHPLFLYGKVPRRPAVRHGRHRQLCGGGVVVPPVLGGDGGAAAGRRASAVAARHRQQGLRLRQLPARLTGRTRLAAIAAAALFVLSGSWIVYNTLILNDFRTSADTQRYLAEYEKRYFRYARLPQPAVTPCRARRRALSRGCPRRGARPLPAAQRHRLADRPRPCAPDESRPRPRRARFSRVRGWSGTTSNSPIASIASTSRCGRGKRARSPSAPAAQQLGFRAAGAETAHRAQRRRPRHARADAAHRHERCRPDRGAEGAPQIRPARTPAPAPARRPGGNAIHAERRRRLDHRRYHRVDDRRPDRRRARQARVRAGRERPPHRAVRVRRADQEPLLDPVGPFCGQEADPQGRRTRHLLPPRASLERRSHDDRDDAPRSTITAAPSGPISSTRRASSSAPTARAARPSRTPSRSAKASSPWTCAIPTRSTRSPCSSPHELAHQWWGHQVLRRADAGRRVALRNAVAIFRADGHAEAAWAKTGSAPSCNSSSTAI